MIGSLLMSSPTKKTVSHDPCNVYSVVLICICIHLYSFFIFTKINMSGTFQGNFFLEEANRSTSKIIRGA